MNRTPQTQTTPMSKSAASAVGGDSGFTVIEIMVYVALVSVVLIIVAGIFSSMYRVQTSVVGGTAAAESAQLVSKSVESGVRNATAVSLQALGSDQFVLARTAGSGSSANWQCDAWYYDAAKKEVRFSYGVGAIAAPTTAQLATWQLLSGGIMPTSGSGIFSLAGSRLSLVFTAKSTNTTVVSVQTSVATEAGSWVSSPCF